MSISYPQGSCTNIQGYMASRDVPTIGGIATWQLSRPVIRVVGASRAREADVTAEFNQLCAGGQSGWYGGYHPERNVQSLFGKRVRHLTGKRSWKKMQKCFTWESKWGISCSKHVYTQYHETFFIDECLTISKHFVFQYLKVFWQSPTSEKLFAVDTIFEQLRRPLTATGVCVLTVMVNGWVLTFWMCSTQMFYLQKNRLLAIKSEASLSVGTFRRRVSLLCSRPAYLENSLC